MKKNRGTRGDSLLILGSIEPLSKKPPLQAEWVSGGSMSHVGYDEKMRLWDVIVKYSGSEEGVAATTFLVEARRHL